MLPCVTPRHSVRRSWKDTPIPTTTTTSTAPPPEFVCPLSLHIMKDPVYIFPNSARSFERSVLERWLQEHPHRDPLTKQRHAEALKFVPNQSLRQAISRWQQKDVSNMHLITGAQQPKSTQGDGVPHGQQPAGEPPHVESAISVEESTRHMHPANSLDISTLSSTHTPPPGLTAIHVADALSSATSSDTSSLDGYLEESVRQLVEGNPSERFGALRALHLAVSQSEAKANALLTIQGAVDAIATMLCEEGDFEGNVLAAKVVRILGCSNRGAASRAAEILLRAINLESHDILIENILTGLIALATKDNLPLEFVIEMGACEKILVLSASLRRARAQELSLRFLSMLAAVSDARLVLVRCGALEVFSKLLSSMLHVRAKGHAMLALKYLIRERDDARRLVAQLPTIFEIIVSMLAYPKNAKDDVRRAALLAAALLEKDAGHAYKRALAQAGGIGAFVSLVAEGEIGADLKPIAAMCLARLASAGERLQTAIILAGAAIPLGRLIRERYGSNTECKKAGSVAILALVTDNTATQYVMIREKIVTPLLFLLNDREDREIRHLASHILQWLVVWKEARTLAASHLGLRWRVLLPSATRVAAKLDAVGKGVASRRAKRMKSRRWCKSSSAQGSVPRSIHKH